MSLRSVSSLSEVALEKRYKEHLKESKLQKNLIKSKKTRLELVVTQIKEYIKNQDKLGIPNYTCHFDPVLADFLNERVKAPRDTSKASFKNYLVDSTVTDIVVQTSKGYIFRVSNKALKKDVSMDLTMVDDDDFITHASYLTTSYLTLITSSGKLVFIERDKIPYSSKGSVHVNQILTWAKVKKFPKLIGLSLYLRWRMYLLISHLYLIINL